MTKLIQKAWLKPYIDINTKLREQGNIIFRKTFLKLRNNAIFGRTLENMRKHRNIKFVATERNRNYLISEPNYHTTKFFTENVLATKMRKNQIIMN